ncbi:MAG: AsmA family protein, partial [Motiliproteus sp.]|nr:AsmA family protein [Motiliproteus sp.]
MKALIKVVVGLVVVVIVAMVAVGMLFDPNDYKAEIQQLARDKASVDLSIDGDIGWSLFPTLGLQLPKVNAKTLEGEQLAAVKKVQVAVKLSALLSGRVEMNGVLIDGLELAVKAPAEGEKSAKGGDDRSGDGSAPALVLDIGNVDIRDANITLDDPAQGRKIVISNFNFSGQGVASAKSFPASMDFQLDLFEGAAQPVTSVKMDLETQLFFDLAKQLFKANGLNLALNLNNQALGEKAVDLKVKGDLIADLTADQATVQSLVVEIANLALQADVEVKQMSGKPQLSGQLKAEPFDANQLLEALGQARVPTRDADALKQVGFSTRLEGPANTLGLKDLVLQLDDTRFTGELNYDLGSGAQVVKLQGDSINVDRYLPPAQAGEQRAAAAPADSSGERYPKTPIFPVEALKPLDLLADIGLTQLQASGMTMNDLVVQVKAKQGILKVSEVSGKLYEGSFNNNATIDLNKQPISLKFNKQISKVQVGGLLKDLAEQDVFSGVYNMKGNFLARGNSVYDIVHSL